MDCLVPYCREISSFEFAAFSGGAKFRNGDTLMARITPCLENGKTAMVSILDDEEIGFGSTEYIVFREKKGISNKYFIYYFVTNPAFRDIAVKSMVGSSGRQRVQQSVLENLEISLPSLAEQGRIAGILGALDDKIECNNRINRNLEEQAAVLFRRWFVDFEFPDPDPTSPTYGKPYRSAGGKMQDSPLGSIPKGWQVKTMSEVSKINAGGDKPKVYSKLPIDNCDIPIYSNGIDDFGLYGYTDTAKILEESITISARGTIGFVCLRTKPYLPIVRLISISPQTEILSAKYLYLWAKNQNINGTGTTQLQLTVPDFRKTEIIIPPTKLMRNFTSIANSIFESIEVNKTENQTIATLRDTLLPKLMNNEI